MLIIILSWIVITAVIYPVGFALNSFLGKLLLPANVNEQVSKAGHLKVIVNDQPFVVNCLSGLMATSFIATTLCLLMPLQMAAFLILAIIALLCAGIYRRSLLFNLKIALTDLKRTNIAVTASFLVFMLIISFCSWLPSSHHDDGLYYSTSIKWLEEYGTVKGLANLNPRIALNSTWHILQAMFSFRFLGVGLFNDLNGLIYLFVFLYSLGGIDQLINGQSDFKVILRAIFFVPVMAFYFTANSDVALYNVNFLESPTPDIPVCLLVWMVFVLFFNARPLSAGLRLDHTVVVLFSVWAISIKLSAMPILLLSVYIFLASVRKTRMAGLSTLIIVPVVFMVPWLVRNVLLSGYLIYPVSAIDVFNVDWKINIGHLKWFENGVKAFALGADLNKPFTTGISEWFPGWFVKQGFISQTIFRFMVIAVFVYLVMLLRSLVKSAGIVWEKHQQLIIVNLILLAGILFWLNKAPDFRFGYGFLCIFCSIFLAWLFRYFLENSVKYLAIPFFVFVFTSQLFNTNKYGTAEIYHTHQLIIACPQK